MKKIIAISILLVASVATAATIQKVRARRKLITAGATNTLNNFINAQICTQVNTNEGRNICDPTVPGSIPEVSFVNKLIDANNDGIEDTQRWLLVVRNRVTYTATSVALP